ncbi:hypothetical protein ASF03_18880 [Rhizobium sp. Leaf68]|nr:hypothetical protein ASE62_17140 [Rhizobium sp. Leaf202]KQN81718.1 hypothetical protein ASF03_18880 [Rhizobium sp. Leaf68]
MFSFRATGLLAICTCAYLGFSAGVHAQDAPSGSCFVAPAKLPDADVQAFLSNPQSLLQQYAVGGMAMQMRVRALAGSNPATLAALISLASPTSDGQAQVAAIGGGLGRAARACVVADPVYAGTIQRSVLESNNQPLIDAFNGANAEAPTAALGGAGAGAGAGGAAVGGPGAGGAVGGSGLPGAQAAGSNGVGQSNGSLVASASSARFFSASGGGGSSSSVSPTAP